MSWSWLSTWQVLCLFWLCQIKVEPPHAPNISISSGAENNSHAAVVRNMFQSQTMSKPKKLRTSRRFWLSKDGRQKCISGKRSKIVIWEDDVTSWLPLHAEIAIFGRRASWLDFFVADERFQTQKLQNGPNMPKRSPKYGKAGCQSEVRKSCFVMLRCQVSKFNF